MSPYFVLSLITSHSYHLSDFMGSIPSRNTAHLDTWTLIHLFRRQQRMYFLRWWSRFQLFHLHSWQPMFPCLLQTLALQCENYQGEKLLCCQLSLDQLAQLQDGWLSVSLQLLGRGSSPGGETPEGQRAAEELARVLSESLKRVGTQVAGETGERLQPLLPFSTS